MDTAPQNPTACPAGTDRRTEQQGWAAARPHRAPSYPNHHEGISKAISQEMRLIHSLPKHQENPQEIPWDPEPNTHTPPAHLGDPTAGPQRCPLHVGAARATCDSSCCRRAAAPKGQEETPQHTSPNVPLGHHEQAEVFAEHSCYKQQREPLAQN